MKYYQVKVAEVYVDEKTGKEKMMNRTYLVEAASTQDAVDKATRELRTELGEFLIKSVNETKYEGVF